MAGSNVRHQSPLGMTVCMFPATMHSKYAKGKVFISVSTKSVHYMLMDPCTFIPVTIIHF